jgi:hypothetical protein
MVYSYASPFETGKLKVSDVHSLQSVSGPFLSFFLGVCLKRMTATKFQEIKMGPQVRPSLFFPPSPVRVLLLVFVGVD